MKSIAACASLALLVPSIASADDVTDAINSGLAAYKAGNYSEAASDLEMAVQNIRQKQAEGLKTVFPKPPAGWTAGEAEIASAGMAMLGGGIAAKRTYTGKPVPVDPKDPDAGTQAPEVEMSIAGESPMLSGMLMMISNPAFAGASGGKVIKIGSYKAMVKKDGDSAELSLIVANKLLVTVNGNDGATESDVTNLAKAIDFAKLEKFAQP